MCRSKHCYIGNLCCCTPAPSSPAEYVIWIYWCWDRVTSRCKGVWTLNCLHQGKSRIQFFSIQIQQAQHYLHLTILKWEYQSLALFAIISNIQKCTQNTKRCLWWYICGCSFEYSICKEELSWILRKANIMGPILFCHAAPLRSTHCMPWVF